MSFKTLLDKYRKHLFSERDKGDRFERLMQAYLQTDSKYTHEFKKIWLWGEFPYCTDLGGGSGQSEIYTGSAAKSDQRQCADGGDRQSIAEGEV